MHYAVDDGEIVLLIAINYSSAFDLVDIQLFIEKFIALSFSDAVCHWIHSYLADRCQIVVGLRKRSASIIRRVGVPQSSILGLLFFYFMLMLYLLLSVTANIIRTLMISSSILVSQLMISTLFFLL